MTRITTGAHCDQHGPYGCPECADTLADTMHGGGDTTLDEIEARANAATKGPWRWVDEYPDEADGSFVRLLEAPEARGVPAYNVLAHRTFWRISESNLEFIAHAREDVPALVGRVRELEESLDEIAELPEPLGSRTSAGARQAAYLKGIARAALAGSSPVAPTAGEERE
jgi:hypothetical protein